VNGERHPKGLYVLFFTEMWERFGFYSMLAMFTLYLRDDRQGFGWTAEDATHLYSNYLMFVYASPLIGGWIADKKLGYRNSVLLGGLIFMVGYFLLSIHSIAAVYAALTCLVVGNGFFKPNVSAMVGHLYPEGSALKERAYNIFYMGINVGALLAPINAEIWAHRIGFNNAFAIAGFGMIVSVAILWLFRSYVDAPHSPATATVTTTSDAAEMPETAAPVSSRPIDLVPESRRIMALLVVFGIAIVFWMVFHQNGSTLTYWANDNTDWNVSGIISNAINPFWVVTLTFPVVWLWGWLHRRDLEPSTPTKITIGMFLCAVSFAVLFAAARTGESQTVTAEMLDAGDFRVTERSLEELQRQGVPAAVIEELGRKDARGKFIVMGRKFTTDRTYADALKTIRQELAEDVKQARADLARHAEEEKSLRARIKQAKEQGTAGEAVEQAEKELQRHLDGKKVLEERLQQLEKDEKAFSEVKIKEGELPAPAQRAAEGNKEFAAALDQALTDARGLSPATAARIRRWAARDFTGKEKLETALARPGMLGPDNAAKYGPAIARASYLFKVSPLWLILAYAVMTLGELLLSPMGLALVSKVAPVRLRGVMMGGWFVATAIGNKLTMIGVYWDIWLQSTFFAVLGMMALGMGVVLLLLLRPLKKSMPGV
jgi:POT family proton-dependent oligopeptide transporter